MKSLVYFLFSVILYFSACGKGNDSRTQTPDFGNSEFSAFENQVEIKMAKNFSVSYHENYKVVELDFQSDEKEMDFSQKLVLVQRGTEPPPKTGELENAWFVTIPVQSVAANEDGEITRLKSLNLTDQIVGMGGGGIYDAVLRKKWENGEITSIGYSFHSIPAPELLMSAGAELLVLHTFDNTRLDGMSKLRELGINAVPQFAWAEADFLAKAEWIKFTSLFFNKEKEANELFNHITSTCDSLISLVSAQPKKVTSFLLYHPSNQSDWTAHRNDFYASYLQAVSTNVLKDNGPTHSVGITNEQLLNFAKDADFWIINSRDDIGWPPASYLNNFKSYREGNVYHYQKRTIFENDAYDWYETPEVRPDLVLEDLVSIFYPELLPDHEPMFFAKVNLLKQ